MKRSRFAKSLEQGAVTLSFVLVIADSSDDFRFCSGWLEALIPLSVIRRVMICDAVVLSAMLTAYVFAWASRRRKGAK